MKAHVVYYPVTFDDSLYNPERHLNCPICGEMYLHQTEVVVYDRGEDEERCLVTSVLKGRTRTLEESGEDNPSRRRHGMTLEFWCEQECHEKHNLELCISQHKGCTQLVWRCSPAHGFNGDVYDPRATYKQEMAFEALLRMRAEGEG